MSTDLRPVVAANLRAERARRGLRQSDLAERVGLPRATLADVESGKRKVALGEAVDLCEALGIGLAELIAGRDPIAVRSRIAFAGGETAAQVRERVAREGLDAVLARADLEPLEH